MGVGEWVMADQTFGYSALTYRFLVTGKLVGYVVRSDGQWFGEVFRDLHQPPVMAAVSADLGEEKRLVEAIYIDSCLRDD